MCFKRFKANIILKGFQYNCLIGEMISQINFMITNHEIFKIWSWLIVAHSLAKWSWLILDHEKSDRALMLRQSTTPWQLYDRQQCKRCLARYY